MKAKEFTKLNELKPEHWVVIKRDYRKWRNSTWRNLGGFIAVIFLASLASLYSGWIRTGSAIAAALVLLELAKSYGHADGFIDGYEAGYEAGICKALGMSAEDAEDMHTRAIEMELQEQILNKRQ